MTETAPAATEQVTTDAVKPKPTVPTTEPVTEPEPDLVLPRLSLTTVRQDSDALDFAEKPVVPYVADEAVTRLLDLRKYPAPFYEACTLTIADLDHTILTEDAACDVRVRGNWTTYYPKKPLRIRFAEKQSVLTLHDGEELKNWVLLAEYKDPSLLRNKTALSISRELLGTDGYYAADAALVELEINGEYWGVYLLTEQQEVGKHRIAVTKPDHENPDTKIGYLLEYDGYSKHEDDLHRFEISYADRAPLTPYDGCGGSMRLFYPQIIGFSVKSDIDTAAQRDFIANYMDKLYRILYAAAYEKTAYQFNADKTDIEKAEITPQQAVEQVVDVQSLADMYILCELFCDADLNWSSFFMDVDFGEDGDGKLRFEAPWDFDSAMGLKDRCQDGKGFYAANLIPDLEDKYDTINPWLAVLAYEDWFQSRVRQTWSKAYNAGIFARGIERISADTDAYTDAFDRNAERWKKKDSLLLKQDKPELSQKEAAQQLAGWLETRVRFLNANWYEEIIETTEPTTEEPTGEPAKESSEESSELLDTAT